jgi:peroxiredoxin
MFSVALLFTSLILASNSLSSLGFPFQLNNKIGAYSTSITPTFLSTSMFSSATDTNNIGMEKVGEKIPNVVLLEGQADYEKPVEVNLHDLIKGKKVIIFAVPGAFTPGCSKSHLPSFITAMKDLELKGVDMVICVATNDAYVMEVSDLFSIKIFSLYFLSKIGYRPERFLHMLIYFFYKTIQNVYPLKAWGRSSGGADVGIRFLSDAKAELTRSLGLAMESDVFVRSKRYSLIAEDGTITHFFSADKQSSDTWAPNVLSAL